LTGATGDFETAAREVAATVGRCVASSVGGERRVGVAFSGGLDSSVVVACASRHARVLACSAYVRGAVDCARARKAAAALGADLLETELNLEDARQALANLALPFAPSLMDRSLWCLYSAVARRAHEAGLKVVLLGQLADELFGGYAKYEEGLERMGERGVRDMMRADFDGYASRGRVRDVGAFSGWVEPRLPFDSRELAELAASIPTSFLIRGGARKAVLRRAAVILGVPEEIAGTPKKAAQYSSGVQKLVASLHF